MHSTLLLRGAKGLGKRKFAGKLAALMLCETFAASHEAATSENLFEVEAAEQPTAPSRACGECTNCALLKAGTHPDIHWLTVEDQKKQVSVDSVRALAESVLKTPQVANIKVCMIDPADALNESSANALLKLLEEPPSGSFFLLVSDHFERLLPTIRSRCRVESFSIPEAGVCIPYLASAFDTEVSRVESVWEANRGFVGDVEHELAGTSTEKDFDGVIALLVSGEAESRRAEIFKQVDKTNYASFVERCTQQFAEMARQSGLSKSGVGLQAGYELYQRSLKLKRDLSTNPNVAASLGTFLQDCSSIARRH